MKERLDGFERVVLKIISLTPAWILTAFIVAAQIILVIVLQTGTSGQDTLDARAMHEIKSLRWLLLPAAIALYVKSAYYFLFLSISKFGGDFEALLTPVNKVLAVVIALAIDTAVLSIVPAAFNFPIFLAVLERGLVYFVMTAGVFAVYATAFYWMRKNPFAFSTLLLASFLSAEYALTWISAEVSKLAFFNDLYVWNSANPHMTSPILALYLDAESVYEMLFVFAVAIAMSLFALKLIFGKDAVSKRDGASVSQQD